MSKPVETPLGLKVAVVLVAAGLLAVVVITIVEGLEIVKELLS